MPVRHPVLTVVTVLGLPIGIPGSLIPIHLFDSPGAELLFDRADRIVGVPQRNVADRRTHLRILDDYFVWKDELAALQELAAARSDPYHIITGDGRAVSAQPTRIILLVLRRAFVGWQLVWRAGSCWASGSCPSCSAYPARRGGAAPGGRGLRASTTLPWFGGRSPSKAPVCTVGNRPSRRCAPKASKNSRGHADGGEGHGRRRSRTVGLSLESDRQYVRIGSTISTSVDRKWKPAGSTPTMRTVCGSCFHAVMSPSRVMVLPTASSPKWRAANAWVTRGSASPQRSRQR